jgi:alpha-L-rhamnosidase
VDTPYGLISSSWKVENGVFALTVQVPVDTTCQLILPDGTTQTLGSGQYSFTC